MKIFATLLLVVACVQANSIFRYGWEPGSESIFRFESHVLTGIPDIHNSQYAGMKFTAQARVQAFPDYTLRIKLEQPRFFTLNGEISLTEAHRIIGTGGANSGAKEQLPQEFRRFLEEPMLVHIKRGLLEDFYVSKNEPVAITNIKKSLLAQLQVDVSGTYGNNLSKGAQLNADIEDYQVWEDSLQGMCQTMYNVYPITEARVLELEQAWEEEEKKAQLSPSVEGKAVCNGKRYFEITKTRDLDHCAFSSAFQKVSGAEANFDITKSHMGNLMTHSISSKTYICGDLSSFNIRKIVAEDNLVNNPIGYNTEQRLRTSTRVMIELLKKESISSRLQVPSQNREESSLFYTYPEQVDWRQLPEEVVSKTLLITGTKPVFPQPGLMEAPKLLVPIQLPKQEIITQIVERIRQIVKQAFETPESGSHKLDTSGEVLTVSKYMQVLSYKELEEVWNTCMGGAACPIMKNLLVDAMAMAGNNPTTMFVLKKIQSGEVSPMKATVAIQSTMKSIKTPTQELLREFVKLVKQWKNNVNALESKQVLTSTLFQISNLFYKAYINRSTMASNYPIRIYGVFGDEKSQVLVDEYIPLLKEMLREYKQSHNKQMELVVITSLGKLGHFDVVKPLIKVAQGMDNEEPMVRSLAVYSMKRTAKRYQSELKSILLAIVNNPEEHADVRVAALAVLPWARPSYSELQMIAVRSWYDPSQHVASFARSTFESLMYTEIDELKSVGIKVRGIMHMFKPTHYGPQYSKDVHISNFVRYLLASVSSKAAFTNTKYELAPSKIDLTTDLYLELMGSGLRLNYNSFSVYSQGIDKVIDFTMKYASDVAQSSGDVTEGLVKIAKELHLKTRVGPPVMSFIQQRTMGYEFAAFFDFETMMEMLDKPLTALKDGVFRRGIEYENVGATNLVSVEFYGTNDAGFPSFAEIDFPSTFATNVSIKYDPSAQWMFKGSLTPVWNTKIQSNYGLISPFTEEILGTGVTMAFHTSAPIESFVSMKRGEVDVVIKAPEATLMKGKNMDYIHAFVMPYTFRKPIRSVQTINKAQDLKKILTGEPLKRIAKPLHDLVTGEFSAETDNQFVDFYSYWEKIKQHDVNSLLTVGPLMSSVRMSSVKLTINPAMSELKEVALKYRLYTQKPNGYMHVISKPIDQALISEIESKGIESVKKTLHLLRGAPATVMRLEVALKERSATKVVEGFTAFGYNPISNYHTKSSAAAAIKLPQGEAYGVYYGGDLKTTQVLARWDTEQLLQQPLNVYYGGEIFYGPESQQHNQRRIALNSRLWKSQEQVRSVRGSEEFKKCTEEANAGRRLSPICLKVRHESGSLDKAELTLQFPPEIAKCPSLRTIEAYIKAQFVANYQPNVHIPQLPLGRVKLEFEFARAGDVAQIKVEHSKDAYKLENIRIPYMAQGMFPLCARNPMNDWLEQKTTHNMAPASCRVEPESVTSFDNKTYAYKINDCEHVLMMDGSRHYPMAVLSRTIAGRKKIVKILSGKAVIELVPPTRGSNVKLNGRMLALNRGQTLFEKDGNTGNVVAHFGYHQDGVYHIYLPSQQLHVLTDGVSIEVIAPQLLRGRSVGLCGDLNGEVVADIKTPQECIMKPKLAAMSYMLNKEGNRASSYGAKCSGIPSSDLPELKHEEQLCNKEETIPTPLIAAFERLQSAMSSGIGGRGMSFSGRWIGLPMGRGNSGSNGVLGMKGGYGASEMGGRNGIKEETIPTPLIAAFERLGSNGVLEMRGGYGASEMGSRNVDSGCRRWCIGHWCIAHGCLDGKSGMNNGRGRHESFSNNGGFSSNHGSW